MKYYMMKLHEAFTHAPDLINWYFAFDVRKLRPETADEIPYRSLIEIRPDEMLMFTDLITSPYLLISPLLKKVLAAYEPLIAYKDVVLLDKANRRCALYYLPILPEADCLHASSECNLDRSVIRKVVLAREKLPEESIFRIGGVKDTHIVVRLDLAESFLRRKAAGIGLAAVEIK